MVKVKTHLARQGSAFWTFSLHYAQSRNLATICTLLFRALADLPREIVHIWIFTVMSVILLKFWIYSQHISFTSIYWRYSCQEWKIYKYIYCEGMYSMQIGCLCVPQSGSCTREYSTSIETMAEGKLSGKGSWIITIGLCVHVSAEGSYIRFRRNL
jgi:hypothetical protein